MFALGSGAPRPGCQLSLPLEEQAALGLVLQLLLSSCDLRERAQNSGLRLPPRRMLTAFRILLGERLGGQGLSLLLQTQCGISPVGTSHQEQWGPRSSCFYPTSVTTTPLPTHVLTFSSSLPGSKSPTKVFGQPSSLVGAGAPCGALPRPRASSADFGPFAGLEEPGAGSAPNSAVIRKVAVGG